MIAQRVGLILAALLALVAVFPALQIDPDPSTGEIGLLPVVVAVLSTGIAVGTGVLFVPAWRGGRRSALCIALLQLAAIVPSLPAFLLPSDLVPPGAVVLAAAGGLLNVTALTLILLDRSPALLYLVMVLVTVVLYAGLTSLASLLVPEVADRAVQTAAAIALAVVFQPLLLLLRRTVGRRVYGGRADPASTALRVGRRMSDVDDVVGDAIEETRRALRLGGLEILDGDRVVARSGEAAPGQTVVTWSPPDQVSDLVFRVTLRPAERRLHSDESAALALVALPLGSLVREVTLIDELRSARAAATEAHERERSLLHRELHDGIGPLLTGAVMRADAAQNLLSSGGDRARAQIEEVRVDLRTAITEVRRIVYGLRPLELEQAGLWSALQQCAARAGASLSIPRRRPELSIAIETAVYRIVSEALANAGRHGSGKPARVQVEASVEELRIEVTNECGRLEHDYHEGVGLSSVRTRAEELSGHADIGPMRGEWHVVVRLPLKRTADETSAQPVELA